MGQAKDAIDQKKKDEKDIGPVGFIQEKNQNERNNKSCIRDA